MIEQVKFTYSPIGKALKKQIKTIENQGEKQIKAIKEHGKQLIESNALIKTTIMVPEEIVQNFFKKEIFNKIIDKRRNEILDLSKKS